MKTTKTMDNKSEAIEVSAQDSAAPAVDGALATNQRRRKLVRSAAACAPLLLTLRSGALAAASCTGAVALGTLKATTGPNFTIADPVLAPPGTVPIQEGQICATNGGASTPLLQCLDAEFPDHIKIDGGMRNGVVVKNSTDGSFECSGGTYNPGEKVAILSAASSTSLYG